MNPETVFVIAGAGTGAVVSAVTVWKWFAPAIRRRRLRIQRGNYMANGKPDMHDDDGNIIEEGYAALPVQVREQGKLLAELHTLVTRQLETNGGSSVTDRIAYITKTVGNLAQRQEQIQVKVDDSAVQIAAARVVAGEAATISARVEQQHRDDVGQIKDTVASLDEKLDQLRTDTSERLVETETKLEDAKIEAAGFRSIAYELAPELFGEAEPDEPDGP